MLQVKGKGDTADGNCIEESVPEEVMSTDVLNDGAGRRLSTATVI